MGGLQSTGLVGQFQDCDGVEGGFGHEARDLHEFRQLRTVSATLGTVIVVAPGTETVERRHSVPYLIAVAQTAALLDIDWYAEFPAGLAPDVGETIRGDASR